MLISIWLQTKYLCIEWHWQVVARFGRWWQQYWQVVARFGRWWQQYWQVVARFGIRLDVEC